MQNNKIMINGRALSGKDTFGDYLVEKYGFNKLFFAQGVYEIARKYFDMKEKDRWLLQNVGDKMREIEPTVWVDYTYKQTNDVGKWAITDVRRYNEYIEGIKHGFLPVRITADYDLRVQRSIERDGSYPDTSLWENESENGADNFDYIEVYNNGCIKDLYHQVDYIMSMNNAKFMEFLKEKYKN